MAYQGEVDLPDHFPLDRAAIVTALGCYEKAAQGVIQCRKYEAKRGGKIGKN